MIRIKVPMFIVAFIASVFSIELYASYPRAELQQCWIKIIRLGITETNTINGHCLAQREAVESAMPEATRPTTRLILDESLQKQIKALSRQVARSRAKQQP